MPPPSSSEMNITEIAQELNTQAPQYLIGELQSLRKQLKGLARTPGSKIFTNQTISEQYAFHHGGRTELQFNIGIEHSSSSNNFRHGVAFSFQRSRALPDRSRLYPNVASFNDFLRQHWMLLREFQMWHFEGGKRIDTYQPTLINPDILENASFIFLGRLQPLERPIDYKAILSDFDRLLPLYEYVESPTHQQHPRPANFAFRPGCPPRAIALQYTREAQHLDITLRHNLLQRALYSHLVTLHGEENVGTECPTFAGIRVDIAVRDADAFTYYEIKTYRSPRACIREAIGQLLEYSYWPGRQPANRLVVVGETPLDNKGKQYLQRLRDLISLNLEYQSISIGIDNN
jgi:hypothetical protein